MMQKATEKSEIDEVAVTKIKTKFEEWTEWFRPRYDAGKAMATKMKGKTKKNEKAAAST